ncbi:MAG TPA: iron-containing alcohol dehydrogenase family protein [Thermoanaerobaculia bacterium]|jgi:alcohol dehydrogenase class IV|nr:iron-containing alcohol dehydrogenase family protein [Thermoanaerobaculia bacterium]
MIRLPIPLPRLVTPGDTVYGPQASVALQGLPASHAMVVTGESLAPRLLDQIRGRLKAARVTVVRRPRGEPAVEHLQAMAATCAGSPPDLIVGVGGGSSLDAAKLLMVLTEAPETDFAEYERPFSLPPVRRRCRLALLPTTAGSGAEGSSAALVTLGDPPRKVPIVSHDLLPDLAILDPDLLAGIPPPVLAAGLIDAVTHAVEGYLSRLANPLADAFAEKALQMIAAGFPSYRRDPRDPQGILTLQLAAYLAGLVQNLKGVGACHALAHQLARLGIGHGTANGLCLPAVLGAHREQEATAARLARLEDAAGLARVEDLLAELQSYGGLPRALDVSALDDGLALRLCADALADVCTRFHPVDLTVDDYHRLLLRSAA